MMPDDGPGIGRFSECITVDGEQEKVCVKVWKSRNHSRRTQKAANWAFRDGSEYFSISQGKFLIEKKIGGEKNLSSVASTEGYGVLPIVGGN